MKIAWPGITIENRNVAAETALAQRSSSPTSSLMKPFNRSIRKNPRDPDRIPGSLSGQEPSHTHSSGA